MADTRNVSRRNFIVGTGVIGAGLTIGVLSGCSSETGTETAVVLPP